MGKLTLLLKKKKTKGDESSTSDIQDTSSNISAIDLSTPLSLNIPSASLTGSSISQEAQALSLMDDIMDQLSGTTPDTPQPMAKSDFGGMYHVYITQLRMLFIRWILSVVGMRSTHVSSCVPVPPMCGTDTDFLSITALWSHRTIRQYQAPFPICIRITNVSHTPCLFFLFFFILLSSSPLLFFCFYWLH